MAQKLLYKADELLIDNQSGIFQKWFDKIRNRLTESVDDFSEISFNFLFQDSLPKFKEATQTLYVDTKFHNTLIENMLPTLRVMNY